MNLDTSFLPGSVVLVGFGPGDPDLLTIAGYKALGMADIIFHDDLVDVEFLENFKAEKIYVGKRAGKHSFEQEQINELLLNAANQKKKVVRLKGGDPMIFAHGGEEVDFLEKHGIEVNVIPGVTTASALAATEKIGLTYRHVSSSCALVSGHSISDDCRVDADTLVYYMGASQVKNISRQLIGKGRSPQTPVLLVSNVSLPNQTDYETTLEGIVADVPQMPTPMIMLVGDVIKYRGKKSSGQS